MNGWYIAFVMQRFVCPGLKIPTYIASSEKNMFYLNVISLNKCELLSRLQRLLALCSQP